jgi:hypothetical protein
MNNIVKGAIVKFKTAEVREQRGYYRVTSVRGGNVNLGSIFGKTIWHKKISVELVVECESEWYKEWQKSEQYQCM